MAYFKKFSLVKTPPSWVKVQNLKILNYRNPPLKTLQYAFKYELFKLKCPYVLRLEDPKVLKRSPDLLNNVKIGQGQLRLNIQKHILC